MIEMKRIRIVVPLVILMVLALGVLTGCGASLDREVTIEKMMLKVPSDWREIPQENNSATQGEVQFVDQDEDRDEDETVDCITVIYRSFDQTSDNSESASEDEKAKGASATNGAKKTTTVADEALETEEADEPQEKKNSKIPRTAQEALEQKRAELEKEHDVTAWSIDEEKTRVIDGAQATTYEYSFVKEIDGVKHKYECFVAYVISPNMFYEIEVAGNKANLNAIVDSIELDA